MRYDNMPVPLVPDDYFTHNDLKSYTVNDTNINGLILITLYLYAFIFALFIF